MVSPLEAVLNNLLLPKRNGASLYFFNAYARLKGKTIPNLVHLIHPAFAEATAGRHSPFTIHYSLFTIHYSPFTLFSFSIVFFGSGDLNTVLPATNTSAPAFMMSCAL